MAKMGLSDVLSNPAVAVRALEYLDCVDSASVLRARGDRVTIELTLLPFDKTGKFISEGFPIETVNVVIRSNGEIYAVPKLLKGRRWNHRNGRADLCLWYEKDPAELRWSWDDGLKEYVRIVSRHLIYEEYWRRSGEWPIEDTPHGDRPGNPWAIETSAMRMAVRKWRRG